MINRTGQIFGELLVINDNCTSQLICRCKCGTEGNYPRTITKPSYRGPKACPWCLGSPCEECGTLIPNKGRMPSKTCSDICRKARSNRKEKVRYNRIKDTDHFKLSRAEYLDELSILKASDSVLAERLRERHRLVLQTWRMKQLADPELRKRYLQKKREYESARLERIRSDPKKHAEHLLRQREWYHSLSDEDYQRIFVINRKKSKRS
ncbi:hypothetical protein HALA3H3_330021 [Halomonas sp. A3H3]|uniref:hypothetical protein n=1 Tax=Halomonas sp. A3H3 TaxID=1346287 RepID=UPI00038CFF80|nr:hypothetical protein [Halomonas sp. A3H3]CDG52289.1 hypothetical protein HALA3H3_330021 [Halomonas sp. A3H3]